MNAPKLRFSEFEKEWGKFSLNDITEFIDSLHETPEDYVESGYPMVRVADVNGNALDLKKCLKVTKEVYDHFTKRYKPQFGDIVFSRVGTCGESVLINFNDEVCLGQNVVLLKPRESYQFLFHYLNTKLIKSQVDKKVVGSSHKTLSLKDAKRFLISAPCKQEQTKIANFLTAVDEKITHLTQKHDLLTQYKKGVMQQIFSQELRFKDGDGSDFPEWEEKTLGEISIKKSSNIAANKIEENEGDYKIYGASGVLKKVDFFTQSHAYISIVKDGAGVGRVFLCEPKTSVLGTMDIIQPKENIDISFLYAILEQIDFVIYVTGSTIPHIYYKDYSKEEISVPSLIEQTKIANFLTAIDEKIITTKIQLQAIKQYKQGLLQQMFV